MLRSFFFILLLSSFQFLPAQAHSFVYLGFGFSGSVANYQGLNSVIDRYNETRQGQQGAATLMNEMQHFSGQSGYEISLGKIFDDIGWFIDLHLTFLNAETFAEGYNLDGTAVRRNLELESTIFSGGVGKSIIQNHFMELGVGMAIEVNWDKIYSSVDNEDPSRVFEGETPVSLAPFAQTTLFLSRKIPLAAFGRAFVEVPLLLSDYSDFNKSINPNTYVNDENRDFTSLGIRPGFSIGLALIFHERDLSFHP